MVTRQLRKGEELIYSASERFRRNRELNPDHWHHKLFMAWHNAKHPHKKPQLNFCHYVRVVFLWALPRLLWEYRLRQPTQRVLGWAQYSKVPALSIAMMGVVLLGYMVLVYDDLRNGLAILICIVAAIVGLAVTTNYWWCVLMESGYGKWVDLRKVSPWWGLPTLVVFTIPAGVVLAVLLAALLAADAWHWLATGYMWQERALNGARTFVVALNAHPHNRPFLRPWTILAVAASFILVGGATQSYQFPPALYAVLTGIEFVAIAFITELSVTGLKQRKERKVLHEKTAIFQIIGIRHWLWNDSCSAARHFRSTYAYNYALSRRGAETPASQIAAIVKAEDAHMYLREFLFEHRLPVSQQDTIPKRLTPIVVQAGKQLHTAPTARQRFVSFWVATWALIRLLWAGVVFAKRVGACPTLTVKDGGTSPANEQPVTQ